MIRYDKKVYPWLVPKTRRRTIKRDVKKFYEPDQIYKIITTKEWNYSGGRFNVKGTQYGRDKYHARDRALLSLMFLTSGRIHEVLLLKKNQFKEMIEISSYKNPDDDILIVHQFYVGKRKKGQINPIIDLPLPRKGRLAKFTMLVEEYLDYIDKDEKLFKFGQSRAWVITNHITGKWNHWFRAQSLSYQVNLLGSALRVARQRGIGNPSTIQHYYRGEWIVDKERLKE